METSYFLVRGVVRLGLLEASLVWYAQHHEPLNFLAGLICRLLASIDSEALGLLRCFTQPTLNSLPTLTKDLSPERAEPLGTMSQSPEVLGENWHRFPVRGCRRAVAGR